MSHSFTLPCAPRAALRPVILHAALIAALAACAAQVRAQEATAASSTTAAARDGATGTELPTVYVTSRKRLESAKDVPVAVSALEGFELRDLRIGTAEDMLRMTPNVGFSSLGDGRSTYMAIRGIGPMAQPLGNDDTSIVVYVDGVPQPLFAADQSLLDADRVEVLRGPQGTLFGRNAQGGAINIITRQPGDTVEMEGGAEVGSSDYRRGWATISGPLKEDKLAGRLAFSYTARDGDVRNLVGRDVGDAASPALRGSLVATPDADTKLTLSIYGQEDHNVPANFVLKHTDGFPEVALDPKGHTDRKIGAIAFTAERRFAKVVATSVTALNHYDYDSLSNNSEALTFSKVFGMPASAFLPATDFSTYNENQNTFHQEFRLASLPQARTSWVAGLNYYQDNYHLRSYYQSPFFAATNGWRDNRYTTHSYAAFGEVTTPISRDDRWKLTGGLRYTRENKTYSADYRNNGFPGNVDAHDQSGRLGYNLVTGRVSLGYDVTPDSNVYLSAAHGAKSGGFPNFTNNTVSGLNDEPYAASRSWSFELGSKNQLLDDRLSLNAAVFLNSVKNENLTALDSSSFTFVPKSIDTRSYGAEIEARYRAARGLDIWGSFGYTHATLRNVSDEVASFSGAASGNRVPSVPRFNAALTVQYRAPAASIGIPRASDAYVAAQYQYIGSREADVGSHFKLDSYAIVNAKIGVAFGNADVYVFGQNLTDEHPQYIGLYYGPGAEAVTVGNGRVVGLGMTVRY
ncbi:TonB-dependent receptor [Bordetella genomosp. 10]|uniref:TonB-dependent receptor n=1 Tax=Bordetella genomosp. 10 TaxID=1416804 RepID=A0A261S1T9_9BORD|nr:TonB-dependent receptor [Bordetella genomosp. 10]OZI30463.1 TonB-dependent receptor [Bordetella genomosp. 10]